MQYILKEVVVIDPQSEWHNKQVNILIEGGVIQSITALMIDVAAAKVLDIPVLCVSPGWVDLCAH